MFHRVMRRYVTGDGRRWKAFSLDLGVCACGQSHDEALENLQAASQLCLRDRGAMPFEAMRGHSK